MRKPTHSPRLVRLLAGTTPLLLALVATGCKEEEKAPAPAASATAAATAPSASAATPAPAPSDSAAAADENIAPPTPVVSGDPDVPVNEAVVGTTPLPPEADTAPPAPVVEDKPPPPEPADVWVPGYWWWSRTTKHYAWVTGAWRNPPPDHVWTPGSWVGATGHYNWHPGFWGPKGYAPIVAEIAPPPPRVEAMPASPGSGYVWAPGYYAFKDKAYAWTPGVWNRPPQPGFGWVAPTYVNTGGHYYFQPGRWDHPIAQRGVAYRPDPLVKPGAHFKPVALPAAVIAEHESFVVRSNEAVLHGATRLPTGGFVLHHEPVRPAEEPHPGAPPPPPHRP